MKNLSFVQHLVFYLFKTYKFFLHILTGRSELERICTNTQVSKTTVVQVDHAIENSSQLALQRTQLHNAIPSDDPELILATSATLTAAIVTIKGMKPHGPIAVLRGSILGIYQANGLLNALEELRKRPFEEKDEPERTERNQARLKGLWKDLNPDSRAIELVSDLWQEIGFQGRNPATDFRGMGMLGLESLAHFAQHHSELARAVVLTSQHPTKWFPFAITGIQISKFLLDKAKTHSLHHHFYPTATLEQFGELFSATYARFHRFWIKENGTVTEFPFVFERFQASMVPDLEDKTKTLEDLFPPGSHQ